MKVFPVFFGIFVHFLATQGFSLNAIIPLNSNGRIVGGVPALRNEFPFQLSLRNRGSHFCGASVIEEVWAVTAAHCVDGISTGGLSIAAGEYSLSKFEETEQIRRIGKIIVHENYNTPYLANDIALLRLSSPLTFNEAVGAISLPYSYYDATGMSTVTGWEITEDGGSDLSDILMKVDVPIVTDEECRESYGYNMVDSMICSGYPEGGKDSCQGDSGGPMTVSSNGTRYLAGVVSWGYGCARPGYPGVYTEVSKFADWISHHVGHVATDPSNPTFPELFENFNGKWLF